MLSVRACAQGLNLVVLLLCTSELERSNESEPTYLLEESASPFIDEGDGLTRERESTYATKSCCPRRRVQNDYRRPQHYLCQTHVGGFTCVHHVWQMTAPTTLSMPRGMWGVLPCLPGMGINGAHNIVGQIVGADNTAWVLTCSGGCRAPF